MVHSVAIPKLGLTMVDCTLVEWAKQDGEKVSRGDVLYTVETDKISNEIEADGDGFLQRAADVDTVHPVGAVIGYLHGTKAAALAAERDGTDAVLAQLEAPAEAPTPPAVKMTMREQSRDGGRILVSPVARRIAEENGLETDELTGTGPGGAILKRDVERSLAEAPSKVAPAQVPASVEPIRRPLSSMRRSIANRMMQSLQGSAQMTGFGSVDMAEAVNIRTACVAAEDELGVRISFTDIVLKAAAEVLAEMPAINSSIIGEEIVVWNEVNVAMAVSLDDGLVVPVIRNADRKSLVEIAHQRLDLAGRARAGTLVREDMEGGSFSVSNFGSYGGDFETPILNPPQAALLGIGQITDTPVVHDGEIVIRPMMTISLTFDHRLIDGAVAGHFRKRLKSLLECPALLMARLR